MGPLLPIITKSIMGNNESIITHYVPTQLADVPPISLFSATSPSSSRTGLHALAACLAARRRILTHYRDVGQPIWPLVPSSFSGHVLARILGLARPLAISYDTSVHAWGAIMRRRTSPGVDGRGIIGSYT